MKLEFTGGWKGAKVAGKVMNLTEATSRVLDLKFNTVLEITSDNLRVDKHSGNYILLLVEEYGEAILFYLDKDFNLRQVWQGLDNFVLQALYMNVADEMQVRVLKSSNKQAYRVVNVNGFGEKKVMKIPYKNKSSQSVTKTYMTLLDALKTAAYIYRTTNTLYRKYQVITPKGTVLMEVGK